MLSSFAVVICVLLPRAPVSAVATAFVSCRHIYLIIMSHSLIFCFVSQINLKLKLKYPCLIALFGSTRHGVCLFVCVQLRIFRITCGGCIARYDSQIRLLRGKRDQQIDQIAVRLSTIADDTGTQMHNRSYHRSGGLQVECEPTHMNSDPSSASQPLSSVSLFIFFRHLILLCYFIKMNSACKLQLLGLLFVIQIIMSVLVSANL